jgi:hypothetical protein
MRGVAVSAASERHANPAHDVVGRILGNYPHDDPAASLKCLEPAHIPYVLASAAAVLVTVILNGDFEPFPAHVQYRHGPKLRDHGYLCVRSRQSRVDQ